MMTAPIWYVFGVWILWMLQFALLRPKHKITPVKTAPNGRWGLGFQALGYLAIYFPARTHWMEPIPVWRLFAGTAFGLWAICLVSASIRHLGKQWRVNAALNPDHELIMTGPYRFVRHPIYASMFAMNIMSLLLLARLPWSPIGVALFILGIEIRIHVEDALLRERFGAQFETWKRQIPAYLPPIR